MADIGFGPLWRVDGPLPIPQERGLLYTAGQPAAGVRFVDDYDTDLQGRQVERWLNGVAVYPYPPDTGDVFRFCGTGSEADAKNFGQAVKQPEYEPMTIYLAETCTSYKVWDQERFKARATAALAAVESFLVAREFMTGAKLSAQPFLADGEGDFPNGDVATSPIHGLTILEEAIAGSGRQGLIHCSPMLATTLMGAGFALADKTGAIRTINGIVVIADFGYAGGATPTGHTPAGATQEWAFATGPIDIRRTEMFVLPETVQEALDRGSGATNGTPNSITYRAERYYLPIWDTELQASVLIDRCQTTCAPA